MGAVAPCSGDDDLLQQHRGILLVSKGPRAAAAAVGVASGFGGVQTFAHFRIESPV